MKQRYCELTHDLCLRAAFACYERKWHRPDFRALMWKYGGVSDPELRQDEEQQAVNAKLEAIEGIAYEMEQRVLDLLDGDPDALELDPVKERPHIDGIKQKRRIIAECCVMHQLLNHLAVQGLMPLLMARILPQQHASIPGRGQVGCKRQVERYLRRKSLGIRYALKLDVEKAYPNTHPAVVLGLLRREIPSARWLLALVEALLAMSPRGGLIIGGYLEAWLFNFVMSYALRYILSRGKCKRGAWQPLVGRLVAYMDDVCLLGRRRADLVSAARQLAKWMQAELGLTLTMGAEVAFLSIEEEHRRRHLKGAARGCPGLDIAGFVIHRTYTTIRKTTFLRARRQLLRAGRGMERAGYVPLFRAYKLVSYYGHFTETASRAVREHLQVDKLKAAAAKTISRCARAAAMAERQERILQYA